jgi:hypothetical protein
MLLVWSFGSGVEATNMFDAFGWTLNASDWSLQ